MPDTHDFGGDGRSGEGTAPTPAFDPRSAAWQLRPDWWQAADQRWYPPELHPGTHPAQGAEATTPALGTTAHDAPRRSARDLLVRLAGWIRNLGNPTRVDLSRLAAVLAMSGAGALCVVLMLGGTNAPQKYGARSVLQPPAGSGGSTAGTGDTSGTASSSGGSGFNWSDIGGANVEPGWSTPSALDTCSPTDPSCNGFGSSCDPTSPTCATLPTCNLGDPTCDTLPSCDPADPACSTTTTWPGDSTTTAPGDTTTTAPGDTTTTSPGDTTTTAPGATTTSLPIGPPPAGTTTTVPTAPVRYEAEATGNTLSGSAKSESCSSCSGKAIVMYLNDSSNAGDTINKVAATTTGTYVVTVGYATAQNRSIAVSVNGAASFTMQAANTGGWTTVKTTTITVTLKAGTNTIRFFYAGNATPNLDYIDVPRAPR